MTSTHLSIFSRTNSAYPILAVLLAAFGADPALAEDWGAYSIIPASARGFVLEAVGSGKIDGTVVSIGKPSAAPNQKWVITAKGNDYYSIKPSYSSDLVLAVSKGSKEIGAAVVLETDQGKPWQEWKLQKNAGGSYCLIPKHAPEKGLDHLGGKPAVGAKIDLWTNNPGDQHLEWIVKPLAGSMPEAGSTESAASSYVAPEIEPGKILKGMLKEFTFSSSKVFPGTTRQVSLFIPAQYDSSKPACVYVKTDGFNPIEQTLLERMIATKEIPVTIGVFVRPGDLPASINNTMGRRNRCFEYDGMGDNNVRFLIDELLPFVAKEYKLNLSTNGNDRCIAGGSSGGITAFNAAWERPEAFSRVYANSGSFVAFRGGHEFPTLVRKFEAKPIRAYLTTGTRDMENCAGDWFLIDQEMDKALKFSGYDYSFRIINGGHVAGYYDYFQEAMSYLWKDWPKPVKAGPSAPRVRDVIVPDEPWELVAGNRLDARGPAASSRGDVYFVEAGKNTIQHIDVDGNVEAFSSEPDQAESLTVGSMGEVYSVSSKTGRIVKYNASGGGSLVVDGIQGQYLLAMPNGGLYVTADGDDSADSGSVWYVKDGKKKQVDSGLKFATGLAYRPDQWLLSVADGRSKWAYSYQINADGSLANKERFFWLHVPDWEDDAGAGSICYAKEGQMLVATRFGVQICADDGPAQVILPTPDRGRVLGVCLGGRDMNTLFAFCGDRIWKRKVKLHGIGAFSPWNPVHGSPL